MDSIEYRHEILLTQPVNVIAYYELETPESAGYNLVSFIFKRLANGYNDDSPAFILDLLSTCLDDFLKPFDYTKFVSVVGWFQLVR